jgi:hypothetical protein
MEVGLILPEPGHEQGWFDENRARLAELGLTAGTPSPLVINQ